MDPFFANLLLGVKWQISRNQCFLFVFLIHGQLTNCRMQTLHKTGPVVILWIECTKVCRRIDESGCPTVRVQKVLLEHAVFRSINYTFKKWTGETGHSNLFSFRFWSLTEWLVVYIASKWISRIVGAKGWSNMKPCVWRDWWRRGWMDPQWRPVAAEQPRLANQLPNNWPLNLTSVRFIMHWLWVTWCWGMPGGVTWDWMATQVVL